MNNLHLGPLLAPTNSIPPMRSFSTPSLPPTHPESPPSIVRHPKMIHSRPGWRIILVLSLSIHMVSSAVIPRRPEPTFVATPVLFETLLGQVSALAGSGPGDEKASHSDDATSMSDELATATLSNQEACSNAQQGADDADLQVADLAVSASQTVIETVAAGTVQLQPSGILQTPKVGGASGGAADPTLVVLPAAPLSTLFTSTTTVFTSTTYAETPTNGKPTTIQSTFLFSAPTGLVRVATSNDQLEASTSNKSIAIEAGVVVGVIILLTGILPHCCCMCQRRRRQPLAHQQLESPQEIPNPFISESESVVLNRGSWTPYIDRLRTREHRLSSSNTISTRQLYISNQVNRARQKVAELEEISSLLLCCSRGNSLRSASGTVRDPPAVAAEKDEPAPTDNPELPGVQVQLERANQQIEELNTRIRELEMQRRSSWALGLSDDPPPGYFE
ncbi:hypothetical protein MVEN_01484500 [Mycena venus]|uniref:Transmembrane protein n=1 Tax=Mycena venus TaxID=2733690 RepID=A0A8H7CT46_9AGAR|nr:hypothetical protein MVEN_01484500 [Mycena venus]